MKIEELAQSIENALTGKDEVEMPWMKKIGEVETLTNRINHARQIIRTVINS